MHNLKSCASNLTNLPTPISQKLDNSIFSIQMFPYLLTLLFALLVFFREFPPKQHDKSFQSQTHIKTGILL